MAGNNLLNLSVWYVYHQQYSQSKKHYAYPLGGREGTEKSACRIIPEKFDYESAGGV